MSGVEPLKGDRGRPINRYVDRGKPRAAQLTAALSGALVLMFGFGAGTARAAPTTTAPVDLSPAIVPVPVVRMLAVHVSGGRVELELACVFAACEVTAELTTTEHRHAGTVTSLSGTGRGRESEAVRIADPRRLRILPGAKVTLDLDLDRAGRRLLQAFRRIPARATLELTNRAPVTAVARSLELG